MHPPRPDQQRREKTTPHASRMLLLSQLPQAARRPQPPGGLAPVRVNEPLILPGAAARQRAAASAPAGSELAHDARNLFSALHLYCDLLASPGVLAPGFAHYAGDLRALGATGMRLVEALAAAAGSPQDTTPLIRRRPFPGIEDLGAELLTLEAPLRALAGPTVRLEVECVPCAGRLALNSEDLLRILFNLVANSVEAMRTGRASCPDGLLRITAQRGGAASFLPRSSSGCAETVVLSVRDNGPGIAAANLERIFDPGFTTRERPAPGEARPPRGPECGRDEESELRSSRGLGLAIVRQLVEAAGGTVRAVSSPGLGARFDFELPVAPGAEPGGSGKRAADGAKRIFKIPAAKRKRGVLC